MSKRMKLSSQFQLRKHVDDDNGSFVDHISQLPDEILMTILSRLTMREAAQSSIISQRWKQLWTFADLNLDFDAPSVMFRLDREYCDNREMLMKNEGNKFAKWVNQILVSHKSEVAGGFKICFGLDNTHKWNLDRWIQFAIQQKKVNRLELLLQQDYYGVEKVLYSLPEEVLTYSHISLLRVFRLSDVEVSGTVLEGILTKCPSLEEISVSWSPTLLGVKVCGINLKLIEIRHCANLEYVEVDSPNLMSFLYCGARASIRIAQPTPKLHAMELGACYSDAHFPIYPEVSSFFSQIETIALDYGELFICEVPPVFPEYKILKCLRLKLGTHDGKSLLSCISMLKKCPMLHTFVVEFYWSSKHIERKMEKIEGEELQFLKVAEFKWFSGYSADQELVISIIQNSPNLEKLIFDPWNPICKVEQDLRGLPNVVRYDINTRRVEARKRAKQLADKYCRTNIQVVIV